MKKMMIVGAALMLVGAGCFGGNVNDEMHDGDDVVMNADRVELADGSYVLDLEASSLSWVAAKAVGASHNGTFALNGGTVEVRDGQFASVEVEIGVADLEVLDMEGEDPVETHLRSDDFFNVEEFPTAQFSLTSVEGAEYVMSEMAIVGDLTLKDQIAAQNVMIDVAKSDSGFTVSGDFELDRTRWGITFGSGSFFDNLGDNVINDTVDMDLNLVFVAEGEGMMDDDSNDAEEKEEMMDEDEESSSENEK